MGEAMEVMFDRVTGLDVGKAGDGCASAGPTRTVGGAARADVQDDHWIVAADARLAGRSRVGYDSCADAAP
jgi:hypothetical protein